MLSVHGVRDDTPKLLSFWLVEPGYVHVSHYAALGFGHESLEEFFGRTRSSFLSVPRAAQYLTRRLCERWGIRQPRQPASGRIRDLCLGLEDNVWNIIILPPEELEKQVVLPLGCALISDRVLRSLPGDEVRRFEDKLGRNLHRVLVNFVGLSGNASNCIPYESLRYRVGPDNFLVEAKKIGLNYFLAACLLLGRDLALRTMLKLEYRPQYMGQEETRPLVLPERDKKRIWSFIHNVWREIGTVCFAS